MHISYILLGSMLLVSVLAYNTTQAAEPFSYTPIPTTLPAPSGTTILQIQPSGTLLPTPHEESLLLQASTILGHIAVADIALFHEIYPEATANIKFARNAAKDMLQETELFSSSTSITLANLSYRSPGEEKDFWLPLLSDHLVVRTMDGHFLSVKKPDVHPADAQITHYRIYLNVRTVLDNLADAERALKEKSYKEAEFAIHEVIRSTFVDRSATNNPFVDIQDHIILANELVRDRNYVSAAISLSHAALLIKDLSAQLPAHDKQRTALTALLSDMTDIQNQLSRWPNNTSRSDADSERILSRWIHNFPEKFLSQSR